MSGVEVPGSFPAEGPRPVAEPESAIPSLSVCTEIVSRRSLPWSFRQAVLNLTAGTLWRLPGRFGIARALGPSYSLRCVVFHDTSVSESPFTKGMGVSITPAKLETVLTFLASHYVPVSLQDILDDAGGRGLPPRSILLTFDDGYASVMDTAVPLCRKLGLPAIFFVNVAFLDNQRLAPDNLVCYVANVLGMQTINAAARIIKGFDTPQLHSQTDVYRRFFPSLSLSEREAFLVTLVQLGGISERDLAEESRLFLTRKQLCDLVSMNFEVGSHTYSHVHCRSLTSDNFDQEINSNKIELERLLGRKVRSFSLPYGSSEDLTIDLKRHLKASGYEAVFLSESVANPRGADTFHLDRVSSCADNDESFFLELEILPRLRAIRNQLSDSSYS